MIVSVAQAQLYFLALTRILAMMIAVPVLGGQTIPLQVRVGLGLILAAILLPWQPLPPQTEWMDGLAYAIWVVREVLIGTLAGFAARLTFGALQIAGEAMGLGSGFASSRLFNPAIAESSTALDQFFMMVVMLYFLVIDGHHLFLIAVKKTFEILPLMAPLPLDRMDVLMQTTAQLILAGVHLALPVMAALFLTDLTLGLLARVAPQVQVYFLGLPLKIGVSLIAMGLVIVVGLPLIGNLYREIAPRMLTLIGN
ncbi:MAG: flagellar biosynthetic protein FliR [Chloroflexota bacterium]